MTSKTKKRKKVKQKKGIRIADVILIIGLVVILVPVGIFGWLLVSAQMETGTPVVGDRYLNDHDPEITKSDISDVEATLKNVVGVDSTTVELTTGTLRVYVDVKDSSSKSEMEVIADDVYSRVTNVLPASKYFTRQDGKKMYDLEVHVYNLSSNRDSSDFIYLIKMKTSNMSEPSSQFVSDAVDEELAAELRQDVENKNNPQAVSSDDDGDITVGGIDEEGMGEPEDTDSGETGEDGD